MVTEIVLEKCQVHLSQEQFTDMDRHLTPVDPDDAVRLSNNGKAPGLDGLPFEFYKILDILFQQSKGSDHEKFDILTFLTRLYEDIEVFGIAADTHFNSGWMAPLFKRVINL